MRLEFDENGYVCCVLYGCMSGSCQEYTGIVPTEPEEYADIDDWADRAKVQAYYLDALGNLNYDPVRAASLPAEDEITPYTADECQKLGIAPAKHTHSTEDFDLSGITTDNISDIACRSPGLLKIGKTVIVGGTLKPISINNTTGGAGVYTIDFSDAGFSAAPCITVTPFCLQTANTPYGIMTYIRELSITGATIRATSNYSTSALSVGIHWMAIGVSS